MMVMTGCETPEPRNSQASEPSSVVEESSAPAEEAKSLWVLREGEFPRKPHTPDQEEIEDIGGTLRLGSYPCILAEGSRSYELFGKKEIHERHRHRYEVNNDYRATLTEHGMKLCGTSPDGRIVEMIELPDHPWFIATQAHPELKSRPNRPHPLFRGFVEAATKCKR